MRGQPILGESTQLCRELSDKKDTQATKRIIQEKLLILTLLGSFLVLKNFTRLFILSICFFFSVCQAKLADSLVFALVPVS